MTTGEKLFLLLAEELNFHKTAEKAFITQQCLSDHIRRMEKYYGAALFTRRPKVALTEVGKAVYASLLEIQKIESGLRKEIVEIENGTTGTLRIGANYTRARILIPRFFKWYHQKYSNVKISLTLAETLEMCKLLQAGKIDCFLGVNTQPMPQMQMETLGYEDIYFVVSRKYLKEYLGLNADLIKNHVTEIDFHALQGLPFVINDQKSTTFKVIEQYAIMAKISIDNILSVSDYDILIELCSSGLVASFCPQFFCHGLFL